MSAAALAHRRLPATPLASESHFASAKPPPPQFASDKPAAVVSLLVGRHCAGMAARASGENALGYLLGQREGTPDIERTTRSLLNGCSAADARHIVVLCQVPVDRMARRVRELDVTNIPLIRFLNQFASPP